jgi:hypothetical protein
MIIKSFFSIWCYHDRPLKEMIILYDKRDDFNFPIVNFPFIFNNIPAAPAYGVYLSQMIRYSRACGSYQDFLDRWLPRIPLKTRRELGCFGRVGSFCSTHRVNLVTNPVISREWGKDQKVLTTSGTYEPLVPFGKVEVITSNMFRSPPWLGWPIWNICVTNDHGYVPLVVNTFWSFPHSRLITGYVRSDDFNLTKRNQWFSNFLVSSNHLSRKSW